MTKLSREQMKQVLGGKDPPILGCGFCSTNGGITWQAACGYRPNLGRCEADPECNTICMLVEA